MFGQSNPQGTVLAPVSEVQTVDFPRPQISPTRDSYPITSSQDRSLVEYWKIFLKRKWVVIACVVIVATVVSIFSFRMTRQYEAVGRLAVYKEGSYNLGLEQKGGLESENDWDYSIDLDTQIRILESDALALAVIKELNLDRLPQFAGKLAKNSASSGLLLADDKDYVRQSELIDRFHKSLNVVVLPRTRVVEIHFLSPDAHLAAEVINRLSNEYMEQNFKTKFESTMRTSDWLSKQLADLEVRVENSQERLVRYQKEHGILGIDDKQNIITVKLDQLNKEVTDAESDRIQKEAIYRLALDNPDVTLKSDQNSVSEKLYSQRADLDTQYATLTTAFGPSYPKVIELKNQMAQLDKEIAAEAKRMVDRQRSEYLAAVQRERMLSSALEEQKKQANELNEEGVEYALLKRDAESNRQLYEGLLEKLKEASITAGLRSSNIRIVDVARVPSKPAKPNIPRNIALGLLVGLFGGVVLAVLLEAIDNSIRTPEEVEAISGLPSLGVVPLFIGESQASKYGRRVVTQLGRAPKNVQLAENLALVSNDRPKSELAECYRALRTSILLSGLGAPPKVLVFTSALPQEGKSTTSANTAIVLAQGGRRVLLVDADLRRPSVHRAFKLHPVVGLSTLLSDSASDVDAAIVQSLVPNLDILPAGPTPPHPSELLGSPRMRELIQQWQSKYDHIVFDSPPTLSVTDAVILSVSADAVILVVRSGHTNKQALRRTRDLLRHVNARVLGVAVNAVDLASPDYYYYYYGSKYSNRYKYYSEGTAALKGKS